MAPDATLTTAGPCAAQVLLARGAAVSARNNEGITPLMRAAADGHAEAARVLLAAGAAVGESDDDSCAALHFAALAGQEVAAQELVAAGAEVDQWGKDRATPLLLACLHGHLQVSGLGADSFGARRESGLCAAGACRNGMVGWGGACWLTAAVCCMQGFGPKGQHAQALIPESYLLQ